MTPKQHLAAILRFWTQFGTRKYLAGQREHGGRLRYKRGMLAHCEEETWDLAAYLPTLRAQLGDVRRLLLRAKSLNVYEHSAVMDPGHEVLAKALALLDQILGPTTNKHLGEE